MYYYDRDVEEIDVYTRPVVSGYITDGNGTPREAIIPGNTPLDWFYVYNSYSPETLTLSITRTSGCNLSLTVEKSSDGINWTTMGTTGSTAITATIPSKSKLYLRCNASRWATGLEYYHQINCNLNFWIGGNINSLLYGSNFTGNETALPSSSYTFCGLFRSTRLINMSDLRMPATTLMEHCYQCMFYGSGAFSSVPSDLLPATTIKQYSYASMFTNCVNLQNAPNLPATIVYYNAYDTMFSGCRKLTTPPTLPENTVYYGNACQNMFNGCTGMTDASNIKKLVSVNSSSGNYAFASMFRGCTKLTTPPQEVKIDSSYYTCEYMFYGCSALTSSPTLSTLAIPNYAYRYMFYNCSNLSTIRCKATSLGSNSTTNWVYGVKSTGSFYVGSKYSFWSRGVNGIPTGWSIR